MRGWNHIPASGVWGHRANCLQSLEWGAWLWQASFIASLKSVLFWQILKSDVNCHSALEGKGLIWVWFLVLVPRYLFSTCDGGREQIALQRALKLHVFICTVVAGFTPTQVILGSNFFYLLIVILFCFIPKSFFSPSPALPSPVVFVPGIFPHFIS